MMEKEEVVFRSRIQDLARLAERRGCVLYSDFLSLNEQSILQELLPALPLSGCEWDGGYAQAERKMAAFIPYYGDEPAFPIVCVKLVPANRKYAEKLTHRDILGALMHLGMERSRLGDIAVTEEEALIFCSEAFAQVICDELRQVRHTSVVCSVCDAKELDYEPKLQRSRSSIASVRLDALIAAAFHESRSSLLGLIEGGKVFVNGKQVTSNAFIPKENDIISVRGMGRFRFSGQEGTSKKGRIWVSIDLFVS